jgi:hypothetical protein
MQLGHDPGLKLTGFKRHAIHNDFRQLAEGSVKSSEDEVLFVACQDRQFESDISLGDGRSQRILYRVRVAETEVDHLERCGLG